MDDLNRVTNDKKESGEECLNLAVIEFLTDEMKMDMDKIKGLGEFKAKRKETDDNYKIYFTFKDESSCEYLYKKISF